MCVVIGVFGHYILIKTNLLKLLTPFINITKLQAGKGKAFNSALQEVELNLFTKDLE